VGCGCGPTIVLFYLLNKPIIIIIIYLIWVLIFRFLYDRIK